MIVQLDPPIPLVSPQGKCIAILVCDYGIEHDNYWTVIQNDTGQLWTWSNRDVLAQENITLGRTKNKEAIVPQGTKVDRVYKALRRQGKSAGSAARIAQSVTGKSLATGRPPKRKKR